MPERQKSISPFFQARELCSEPSEHKTSWDLQNEETPDGFAISTLALFYTSLQLNVIDLAGERSDHMV